ncbi:MAG: response regulator transcription factor [Prochlorotrichaceae cyanobacterium]|jgi:DNA-binding NarL/FixJ family response regulator
MPLQILVAEDDFGTRLAIHDYLEYLGYGVLAATNGQEALKLIYEFHPHLIITDVMMPWLDGYALIQEIRKQPSLRLLPVIFLTARDQTPHRVKGYQLGCDAYLGKPFEMEELGAIVRNLLERSQLIQSEQQFRPGTPEDSDGSDLGFHLSDREHQVLGFLSQGLSNTQIGEQLHLSARTVEKYVSSLLRKTETINRAELVRFALQHHLIH